MADEGPRPPYINFYSSDWIAGTSHLSPSMEWTYLQVCLHNWDKGKAVTRAMMPLIFARNPDWEKDVAALVEMGKLQSTASGALFNTRAVTAFRSAARALEKKAEAGRRGASVKWKNEQENSALNNKPTESDGRNGDLIFSVPPTDWKDFREHRRKIGAPMTPRAEAGILKKLENLQRKFGHDPVAVIDQSIRKGWRDVFPLKGDGDGQGTRGGGLFDGWTSE